MLNGCSNVRDNYNNYAVYLTQAEIDAIAGLEYENCQLAQWNFDNE